MVRNTIQRVAVLDDLKNRYDHPTADMVYTSVKIKVPNISKGTVYRNLKELRDSGEIISFTEQGLEHFDGNNEPHVHFCCGSCQRIWDYEIEDMKSFCRVYDKDFIATNMIVEGVCKDCQK